MLECCFNIKSKKTSFFLRQKSGSVDPQRQRTKLKMSNGKVKLCLVFIFWKTNKINFGMHKTRSLQYGPELNPELRYFLSSGAKESLYHSFEEKHAQK